MPMNKSTGLICSCLLGLLTTTVDDYERSFLFLHQLHGLAMGKLAN
jgi:hypothetical protein